MQPYELTAAAAAGRIAARELSAEDLVRSCLGRIAERDAAVRAWAWLDPDLAIRKARECDKEMATRGPIGPLHGLPFGIKDMIDTADMPTTNNSPAYVSNRPSHDAQCVRVLKAAGGIILGKTDTVEYAAGGRKALTRHPMDPTRTPGGSSSGSGAAVGDRQVQLAFGTQTGGSLIRPAGFNGVYALKPTHGAVAWAGARHLSPTLDTLGWYGRSPQDLALVAKAFRLRGLDVVAPVRVEGLKVGVARTSNWPEAAEESREALARAAMLLRDAGAVVTEVELPEPFAGLNAAQRVIMNGEGGVEFLPEYLTGYETLHEEFRAKVENAEGITAEQLLGAYDLAARCRIDFDALFGGTLDVIVTPSTVGEAPVGLESTGDAVMNSMWTLLHVPCLAIPGHVGPNRLPVGVQIVGRRFSDAGLLAIAAAIAPVLDPKLPAE